MGCIKTHATFGFTKLCQMQLSLTHTSVYKTEYFNLLLTACVEFIPRKRKSICVCVCFSVSLTIF